MTIINSPLNSSFGFSSPNFSVDALGNIVARSITQSEGTDSSAPVDFLITDQGSNSFFIAPNTSPNPEFTVFRSSTYTFELDLDVLVFNIYLEDQSTPFFQGLKHSDGSSGQAALNKQSGKLSWQIPINAPNILYYGNQSSNVFGLINVGDPVGQFSIVSITQAVESTSSNTGSLVIAGGVGVAGNINIGGALVANQLLSSELIALTSLAVNAGTEIVITIDDIETGTITAAGLTMPIIGTNINNTIIGNTTPSTATFISASITELPTTNNNLTSKIYVDSTATALAIAFGI